MKKILILTLILTAITTAQAADKLLAKTTGQADASLPNAREAAVEAALRQAVEIAGGVKLASVTETRDYSIIEDAIYVKTAGLVEKYEVIQENANQDGLYTVRVEAVISRADINTQVEAWKALIKRKGRPRVMVVGSVDRMPFERRLGAEAQGILEGRNLTVIDLDMLKENQRRDAERAAKGDLDPAKAALISREVGADYLVVVQIEGTKYDPQDYYGLKVYPVDATAIVKVIAADTAKLIASKVVSDTESSDTSARAMLAVTSKVTSEALTDAIRRIAAHWLEDVDSRGGAEFSIVAEAFDFDKLQNLTNDLRAMTGVKDIIIDNADYQGRSTVRVIANDTAFNIATVIRQIDPSITIKSSSKYRIVIAPGKTPATMARGISLGMIIIIAVGLAAIVLAVVAVINLAGGKK